MKENKFKIIVIAKTFLFEIDTILCRFPNREIILKDKIKTLTYEIIELIYESNYIPLNKFKDIRILNQSKILSKISMIDLLLEESYKKGYITESIFHEKTALLLDLNKKVRGWIVYEKNNNT
ncbi:MAG: hypothetical protein IJ134_02955 [Bacilli bacterium]|nr:hypothetical protein [Bacilli bacterium]